MKNLCWRGKALKKLTFGKRSNRAGRNSTGSITIFHRGGGSKRLQRRIDFRRNSFSSGIVERIEYDPNRSSRIALVRWSDEKFPPPSYASSAPLAKATLGSFLHNIEFYPGRGGKLVRSAGTFAQLVQKFDNNLCMVRLPSGTDKLLDSRCRATFGVVSNPSHNTEKFKKAGQSRWLGRRPIVRGVAMNPIDHPHGGGEGRTKGGRPSVSPWGKPTKSSYRRLLKQTVLRKQR
uniref:Ribosomal protein L2 n=1 Tax=Gonatozygon brebissonii TaxID=184482 RepID=A0A6G9IGU6_9VIRI|nr:ribosomal protein L2 [Gonatozygon brebissonii]QIQ23074.1 ribosomal protein L2 [Gonatozygon brebissonii]